MRRTKAGTRQVLAAGSTLTGCSGLQGGSNVMSADSHRIFVCTSCRHKGGNCRPGYELLRQLQDAMDKTVPVVGDDFEISGTALLTGCFRPCTVAFRASGKTTYLFGDVDPDPDIDTLVAFADGYRALETDRAVSGRELRQHQRPVLTRSPAAMIVTEADAAALS